MQIWDVLAWFLLGSQNLRKVYPRSSQAVGMAAEASGVMATAAESLSPESVDSIQLQEDFASLLVSGDKVWISSQKTFSKISSCNIYKRP